MSTQAFLRNSKVIWLAHSRKCRFCVKVCWAQSESDIPVEGNERKIRFDGLFRVFFPGCFNAVKDLVIFFFGFSSLLIPEFLSPFQPMIRDMGGGARRGHLSTEMIRWAEMYCSWKVHQHVSLVLACVLRIFFFVCFSISILILIPHRRLIV